MLPIEKENKKTHYLSYTQKNGQLTDILTWIQQHKSNDTKDEEWKTSENEPQIHSQKDVVYNYCEKIRP